MLRRKTDQNFEEIPFGKNVYDGKSADSTGGQNVESLDNLQNL
jgi:hypothetical protein